MSNDLETTNAPDDDHKMNFHETVGPHYGGERRGRPPMGEEFREDIITTSSVEEEDEEE